MTSTKNVASTLSEFLGIFKAIKCGVHVNLIVKQAVLLMPRFYDLILIINHGASPEYSFEFKFDEAKREVPSLELLKEIKLPR